MRIRKPDEPTRQGTYAFHGWLVALRPRILALSSRAPGLSATWITARAICLAAVSLPVTTLAIAAGVLIRGQKFSLLQTSIEVGWRFVATFGILGTIWALVALRAWTWWRSETREAEEQIPWSVITGLATFTFVVWPVVTSPFGWIIPIIWVIELGLGRFVLPVRTWRLAWSFRRRWPMVWTIMDNTTAAVQASFGGGISAFFAKAKTLARPLLNHPALSPIMTFDRFGGVTFWMHAPNGTTLAQARELEAVIAEQYLYVASVSVAVPPRGCSWARLEIGFLVEDEVLEHIEEDIELELRVVEDEAIELGEVA